MTRKRDYEFNEPCFISMIKDSNGKKNKVSKMRKLAKFISENSVITKCLALILCFIPLVVSKVKGF
jgi:hypothetical protein